jgi:hypothetical protein
MFFNLLHRIALGEIDRYGYTIPGSGLLRSS